MREVLITGLGVVSPIGIGADAVWRSIEQRESGVRPIESLERAGWIAPFGGEVVGFDPKQFVKPRKSLKVMDRETQLAFAASELAWADAGLEEVEVDAQRLGVIGAAGLQYCGLDELESPISSSLNDQGAFDMRKWGADGLRELFPLWMLKYLPNMAACHVGIRRQGFGPTNTISLGDVSSPLAMGEAADAIRRGAADVMLAGGTSTRLDLTDLVMHQGAGLSRSKDDPSKVCRPFDLNRDGSVAGEGAAFFVLESREHAENRGFFQRGGATWGSVRSVVSRTEPAIASRQPSGQAIRQACSAALAQAEIEPPRLAMVKAHGASRQATDAFEATALAEVASDTPVFAPTSYFGSLGAAGGSVELAAALIGWREGVVPATLNYDTPDPACPVRMSSEHREAQGEGLLSLSYSLSGQAVATVLSRE